MCNVPMTGWDWTNLGCFRVAVQALVLLAGSDQYFSFSRRWNDGK